MAHRKLPSPEEMPAVFHEWLFWLSSLEDKPATTVRAYNQGVRRIVCFAEIKPDDFSADSFSQRELTDIARTMKVSEKPDPKNPGKTIREFKPATLSQSMAAMKSFLDFCITDGLVKEVPNVSLIRKVSKLAVEQPEPEYYTIGELKRLFDAALMYVDAKKTGDNVRWPERDCAMLSLFAGLGLRVSEVIDADCSWVIFDGLESSKRAVIRVEGKGNKMRRLPLSEELIDILEVWKRARSERFGEPNPDDPLFVTRNGAKRLNYPRLRYWVLRLNKLAGLKNRSLHSLRHTAGVQWASKGVRMAEIQSLLGHASIKTTGVYTDMASVDLLKSIKKSEANNLVAQIVKEIDQ